MYLLATFCIGGFIAIVFGNPRPAVHEGVQARQYYPYPFSFPPVSSTTSASVDPPLLSQSALSTGGPAGTLPGTATTTGTLGTIISGTPTSGLYGNLSSSQTTLTTSDPSTALSISSFLYTYSLPSIVTSPSAAGSSSGLATTSRNTSSASTFNVTLSTTASSTDPSASLGRGPYSFSLVSASGNIGTGTGILGNITSVSRSGIFPTGSYPFPTLRLSAYPTSILVSGTGTGTIGTDPVGTASSGIFPTGRYPFPTLRLPTYPTGVSVIGTGTIGTDPVGTASSGIFPTGRYPFPTLRLPTYPTGISVIGTGTIGTSPGASPTATTTGDPSTTPTLSTNSTTVPSLSVSAITANSTSSSRPTLGTVLSPPIYSTSGDPSASATITPSSVGTIFPTPTTSLGTSNTWEHQHPTASWGYYDSRKHRQHQQDEERVAKRAMNRAYGPSYENYVYARDHNDAAYAGRNYAFE